MTVCQSFYEKRMNPAFLKYLVDRLKEPEEAMVPETPEDLEEGRRKVVTLTNLPVG